MLIVKKWMSTGSIDSTKAVKIALGINFICTVSKILAYMYTGSASMFSEAMHSLADFFNQGLLWLGIVRSKRPLTKKHPFGHGNERYLWGLASAASAFCFGASASLYHGFVAISSSNPVESISIAFYVLALSAVLEFVSIMFATQSVRQSAKENNVSFWKYARFGPDPMGVAVLLEDAAALIGICIAYIGTGLTNYTGLTFFDSFSSMSIGVLLLLVVVFLVEKNASALLGEAIPDSKYDIILEILRKDPSISKVHSAEGVMFGSDIATFSAELDFHPTFFVENYLSRYPSSLLLEKIHSPQDVQYLLDDFSQHTLADLGHQVNRLEDLIFKAVPEVQFINLEAN